MSVKRVALLGLILIAVSCLLLFWNLRAEKLFTLIFVGASTGASTVIFQTVASNRLLTPGIVGFDALFTFLQTALVLSFGAAGYLMLPAVPKFLVETAVLTFCAVALFGILFRKGADDIVRMILTGVILGTLLRPCAGLRRLCQAGDGLAHGGCVHRTGGTGGFSGASGGKSGLQSSLSIIVEFFGGLLFLVLVLRRPK